MAISGIHPELQDAAFEMWLAHQDFEENKGSMQDAPEFWERFEEKRNAYRAAKAALEEKLGHPV